MVTSVEKNRFYCGIFPAFLFIMEDGYFNNNGCCIAYLFFWKEVLTVKVESVKELSMIELAHMIMTEGGQAVVFSELVKEIQETLEMSEGELHERLSQFYTDLNIDGRFIYLGEAGWGLRGWYPYEQIDEEVIMPTKPKKKRSKKAAKVEEDFEEDLLDEEDEDLLDEDLLDEDLLDEEDEEDEDLLDEDDEDLLEDEDEELLGEDLLEEVVVEDEERREF